MNFDIAIELARLHILHGAIEVLVMKGRKAFSVTRRFVTNNRYLWLFRDKYEK